MASEDDVTGEEDSEFDSDSANEERKMAIFEAVQKAKLNSDKKHQAKLDKQNGDEENAKRLQKN